MPALVDASLHVSDLRVDMPYATERNLAGRRLYPEAQCWLQAAVAERLVAAARALRAHGVGLIAHDCYRPWSVQVELWRACPRDGFVADPARGSSHNFAAAVDVGLYDLATGATLSMPSDYDEMSERSRPDYAGGTSAQRRRRDLLAHEMTAAGFRGIATEWWHFDDPAARRSARPLDVGFPALRRRRTGGRGWRRWAWAPGPVGRKQAAPW